MASKHTQPPSNPATVTARILVNNPGMSESRARREAEAELRREAADRHRSYVDSLDDN